MQNSRYRPLEENLGLVHLVGGRRPQAQRKSLCLGLGFALRQLQYGCNSLQFQNLRVLLGRSHPAERSHKVGQVC